MKSSKDYYLAGRKLGTESIAGRIFSFLIAFMFVLLAITPFIYGWEKELQVFGVLFCLLVVNYILCQTYLEDEE